MIGGSAELLERQSEDFGSNQVVEGQNLEQYSEQPQIELASLPALIEAMLFAYATPLGLDRIVEASGHEEQSVLDALSILRAQLLERSSGLELHEVNSGYQLRTRCEFARQIQMLKSLKPKRLSPAALETLAVISYRQPIVKSDIETIRGVDATPTIKTLIDRKLVRIVGHQQTIGQPALYGTTELFLEVFGLKSLADLPNLRELKELERDPGEQGNEEQESEQELDQNGPQQ